VSARAIMGSHDGGLGLGAAAVPLLRNLVHERAGIHFEDSLIDIFADRLAPWSSSVGSSPSWITTTC
jgi:hypothetical protein